MVPVKRHQNSWFPSLFNDFFGPEWSDRHHHVSPAVNILENERCYKVEIAAPGMSKEDFKVQINEDNELLVTLEKPAPQSINPDDEKKDDTTYLRREFTCMQFRQTLLLPDHVERENITARMENGVLTIEIPKKTPADTAAATREIEVL